MVWLGVTLIGAFVLKASPMGHGTHTQLGLPPCASVALFDRPCPGCGLTTSWTALLHGNFAQSQATHALGPFVYLGYTVSAFACLYGFVKGRRFDTTTKWVNRLLMFTVIGFTAYGVVRFVTTPLHSPYHFMYAVSRGR